MTQKKRMIGEVDVKGERERERERDRERQRERERERQRQTDRERQTDRLTDRQAYEALFETNNKKKRRQRDRETLRRRDRETERRRDGETERKGAGRKSLNCFCVVAYVITVSLDCLYFYISAFIFVSNALDGESSFLSLSPLLLYLYHHLNA